MKSKDPKYDKNNKLNKIEQSRAKAFAILYKQSIGRRLY